MRAKTKEEGKSILREASARSWGEKGTKTGELRDATSASFLGIEKGGNWTTTGTGGGGTGLTGEVAEKSEKEEGDS